MKYINQIIICLDEMLSQERFAKKRNVTEVIIRDSSLNLAKSKSKFTVDFKEVESYYDEFFSNGLDFNKLYAKMYDKYKSFEKDKMYGLIILLKTIACIGYIGGPYGKFDGKDLHERVTSIQYDDTYDWLMLLNNGNVIGEIVSKPDYSNIDITAINLDNLNKYDSNDSYMLKFIIAVLNSIVAEGRIVDNGDVYTYNIAQLYQNNEQKVNLPDTSNLIAKFNRDGDIESLYQALNAMYANASRKNRVNPLTALIRTIFILASSKIKEVAQYSKVDLSKSELPYKCIDISKDGNMIAVYGQDSLIGYVSSSREYFKLLQESNSNPTGSQPTVGNDYPFMKFLSEKLQACVPSNYIIDLGYTGSNKSLRFNICDDLTQGIKWNRINAIIKDAIDKKVLSYKELDEKYNAIGYFMQQSLKAELRGNQIKYIAALTLLTYHIIGYVSSDETQSRLSYVDDRMKFNMTKPIEYITVDFANRLILISHGKGDEIKLTEKAPVKYMVDSEDTFKRPEYVTDAQVNAIEKHRVKEQKSADFINNLKNNEDTSGIGRAVELTGKAGNLLGRGVDEVRNRVGGPVKDTNVGGGISPLIIVACIVFIFVVLKIIL